MAELIQGVEITTPPSVEPPTVEKKADPVSPAETEPTKDVEFWKGKAAAMERDAKKAAKRLAELEDAEQKRADAELTEMDKLKRQLAETEQKAVEAERKALRQKVAVETGLPAVLAERLQGDDEEAMREDANKLLEALPKPEAVKKTGPTINPTNPAGAIQTETLEQKKQRLHLNNAPNVFDQFNVESTGGGIFLTEKGSV